MHGSSEDEALSSSGEQPSSDLFVVHKLSKLDTLAGLAIRYNVTVSDIKRSNSLLSDSAMFARDSLLIPTRPLPMGQEYSAWAGMIVTQYGQISRSQDRPAQAYSGRRSGSGEDPSHSAIAQLRAHYGLSPASSPTAAEGRRDTHSDVGFSSGRPGEVEMQDMGALPRRPSLPELSSYAGERNGPPVCDERLRRRRAGDGDEAWGSQDSSVGGSGHLLAAHILPPASGGSSPDRRRPPHLQPPEAGPPGRGLPPAIATGRGPAGAAGRGSGRRRESFLDKIKRAASQPALAQPSGPSLRSVADSAIASIRQAPPELGARGVLRDAAAALQAPKDAQKKE